MEIAEFLLARIAADEREWGNGAFAPVAGQGLSRLILKTRAECAAKRRIIEWAEENGIRGPHHVLYLLALPYADHPDYDPEWKP